MSGRARCGRLTGRDPDAPVELRPAAELHAAAREVVAAVRREVLAALPEAEVLHTGGSSLPGLDTAGDVDVHVRVPPASFPRARAALSARFAARRTEIWRDGLATFAVPGAALPAEVALTARGGEHDRRFTAGWARLRDDPALVDELNRLKRETAGDRRRYEAAKGEFFSRLASADALAPGSSARGPASVAPVAPPDPERTLTTRELNRALLARQFLLERAPLAPAAALERLCGLQAQYAPAAYVGLWSRVAGLERDTLTRALQERAVVQATLLRATVHLAAPGDFWPFALAVRAARRRSFLASRRGTVTAAQMAGAAGALRRRLADGPLHRREVEVLVGRGRLEGVRLWVDLLRVPPLGTWERPRADLYALAEAELGPPAVTPGRGLELLVARYLRAFGPASRRDVASFCGLSVTEVAPALRRVASRTFRGPQGEELLDVADGLLPDADSPAPVRFLGVWDATLLVHARRTGLLPEPLRPRVFHTRNPHGTPTFLVDGAVAGSWRHTGGRVEVEPYGPLDAADRRAVQEEAERLSAFHAEPAAA